MTDKKLQHDVYVRKNIPLAQGESVSEFTQKLSDDVRKFVRQKLNLNVEKSSVFVEEIFNSVAVAEVFKFGPNVDSQDRRKFFAMKFTRKNDGGFEFSNSMEVERKTMFAPKTGVTVSKDKNGDDRKDPMNIPVKKDVEGTENWVEKNLWGGVL